VISDGGVAIKPLLRVLTVLTFCSSYTSVCGSHVCILTRNTRILSRASAKSRYQLREIVTGRQNCSEHLPSLTGASPKPCACRVADYHISCRILRDSVLNTENQFIAFNAYERVLFLHTLHQANALLRSSDAAKDFWPAYSQPTAWVINHLIKLLPL
jgi:hypothetical protein